MTARAVLLVLLLVLGARPGGAQEFPERYFGKWLREERDRMIEIGPCAEQGPICARVIRLLEPDPGKPPPDQARPGIDGRPIVGTVVLDGCRPDKARLKCARSYIPASGRTHEDILLSIEADGRLWTRKPALVGNLGSTYWTRAP